MLDLKPWERAEFLEAARLIGLWMANSQCTPERPWATMTASADMGRFLEKYKPHRGVIRPAGVWLQGLSIMGLLRLSKSPVLDANRFRTAALLGADYLASLQCFDPRWPHAHGALREMTPQATFSAPRDGATGAFALVALFRETGNDEWLWRARLFADWYMTYGSDPDGYPYDDFYLDTGEGKQPLRGDWQAGGALVYYDLWRVTGEQKYLDALVKVVTVLVHLCEEGPIDGTDWNFHTTSRLCRGNDDFANTVLMAAYLALDERTYLDWAVRRLTDELEWQSPAGACPNLGGTGVCALEWLDLAELAAAEDLGIDPAPFERAALKAAQYGLTIQERTSADPLAHGGVYGEANYGLTRTTIHGRDSCYLLPAFLRVGRGGGEQGDMLLFRGA